MPAEGRSDGAQGILSDFEALASELEAAASSYAGGQDDNRAALERARDAALRGVELARRLLGKTEN